MPPSTQQSTPQGALVINRIIWGALIMGELAFMIAATVIISQPAKQPVNDESRPTLIAIAFVLMAVMIPGGFFMRQSTFARNRKDGVIAPGAFGTGSIIFWAACEGPAFFALVSGIIVRNLWPQVIIVGIAIALQVVTFPRRDQIIPKPTTFGG